MTCLAIANDRGVSTPERVDAFGVTRRRRTVVVATVAQRRTDIARDIVRKLVDRIENAAPTPDAFGHVPVFLDQVIANPENVDVLIATFEDETLTMLSSPGVKCFLFRGGALETVTSKAPGLVRTTRDIGSGDAFAICTEGVYTMVSEATIRMAFRDHFYPRDIAWALVEAGRRGHPRSDITAIVLRPSLRRAEDARDEPAT